MDLPPLSEQLADKPAPESLQPVQAFVNTRDFEEGFDLLDERETAQAWLRREGLIGTRARLSPAELSEVRGVREGLRALLVQNCGGSAPTASELRPLRDLARERRPHLDVDSQGRFELGAGPGGELHDSLLRLLLAVHEAQSDGSWSRLKACRNPDCGWAFFDRSRNRQGAWCEMAVCGNRLKNRAFRARHG
jgi:predicted RNA-binding Zn ribbon-like protein